MMKIFLMIFLCKILIAKVRKLYHVMILYDMMQIFLVPDLLETVYLSQSIMFNRIVSIVTDIEM